MTTPRVLVIDRDDPAEPGLLVRRYARVVARFDQAREGWVWELLDAAGRPARASAGTFAGTPAALDAAQLALGGVWESDPLDAL